MQSHLTGYGSLDSILVQADSSEVMDAAQSEVYSILDDRHDTTDTSSRDYQVLNQASLISTVEDTSQVFTVLLGAVAAISLLVGGIGITNIMLVTVTERTREIGIRKAIGASKAAIMGQFLVEATVLSMIGGLAGVARRPVRHALRDRRRHARHPPDLRHRRLRRSRSRSGCSSAATRPTGPHPYDRSRRCDMSEHTPVTVGRSSTTPVPRTGRGRPGEPAAAARARPAQPADVGPAHPARRHVGFIGGAYVERAVRCDASVLPADSLRDSRRGCPAVCPAAPPRGRALPRPSGT